MAEPGSDSGSCNGDRSHSGTCNGEHKHTKLDGSQWGLRRRATASAGDKLDELDERTDGTDGGAGNRLFTAAWRWGRTPEWLSEHRPRTLQRTSISLSVGHEPAQRTQLFADGHQDFGRISASWTIKPGVQGRANR
ncbi:hypothetical protein PPTG_17256 [Phytophthora nicotianae INRA-310]|uniref:Uncharacterized protein n=1 Tax=Phytophthora nicotianae (strain INRA-310) TaxID=761204 RepID=W2PJ92_PHYN3|nr:hypothetical protein PPTG_17256 [Phytophthora nicotianae INRA-310]ETN00927.1 hypothetical protein PPTG_17256 [Phytophthora nicotianae INRA-310]